MRLQAQVMPGANACVKVNNTVRMARLSAKIKFGLPLTEKKCATNKIMVFNLGKKIIIFYIF